MCEKQRLGSLDTTMMKADSVSLRTLITRGTEIIRGIPVPIDVPHAVLFCLSKWSTRKIGKEILDLAQSHEGYIALQTMPSVLDIFGGMTTISKMNT